MFIISLVMSDAIDSDLTPIVIALQHQHQGVIKCWQDPTQPGHTAPQPDRIQRTHLT